MARRNQNTRRKVPRKEKVRIKKVNSELQKRVKELNNN